MNKKELTKKELNKRKKEIEEAIDNDIISFYYSLRVINDLNKIFKPKNTIIIDFEYMKNKNEIAETIINKSKLNKMKKIAYKHAKEDIEILKKIIDD
jgi:hypothetical protein